MGVIEIILVSISLAMDAFAVSICKGLSMKSMNWKKAIIIGLYFGIFQALMPVIGYFLGSSFSSLITNVDHWLVFALLLYIGGNMIKESFSKDDNASDDSVDFKTMLILAIATSIDALAVGITFAFLKINLLLAFSLIGVITFVLCIVGVKVGNRFGCKYESKAEFAGGLILILIGIRILLEHLSIISF